MLRRFVRTVLQTGTGPLGRALLAWRTRGQAERLLRQRGLSDWSGLMYWETGGRVARGPFAGMVYPMRRGDIVRHTKLLGSYESELHGVIEEVVARAPRLVVNVGSGDGYYAVGLARRLPTARIIAVDPDPIAQHSCDDTATRNGVAQRLLRVVRLDADGLQRWLGRVSGRTLCVVDCEGYEDELVDLTRAPALAQSDLIVETHDFARPGVTARLTKRLDRTHHVRRIEIGPRDPSAYREMGNVPREHLAGMLDEFRHQPQSWLVCIARA